MLFASMGIIFFYAFYFINYFAALGELVTSCLYAQSNGVQKWWLRLIPGCSGLVYGELADQYKPVNARIKMFALSIVQIIWSVVFMIVAVVVAINASTGLDTMFGMYDTYGEYSRSDTSNSLIMGIIIGLVIFYSVSIAFSIYSYVVYYRIIAMKAYEHRVIWTIGAVLFPAVVMFIFELIYMNKPGVPLVYREGVPVPVPVENVIPPSQ